MNRDNPDLSLTPEANTALVDFFWGEDIFGEAFAEATE
jgi:hypothetical protein